jgi:RNA polymerase sigma-70 factor (ECF subfamily)
MPDDMPDHGLPDRRALAEGRPEAFAALYDRHARWMLAVARALTSSPTDAEDVVQETFLELHRSRAALARAGAPRAYLWRAVRNAALRGRARRREVALEHEPSARAAAEADPELARALASLPEEQREVVALKAEGALTFEEIGELLGIPANTAASRYRYALAKLRDALGGAP